MTHSVLSRSVAAAAVASFLALAASTSAFADEPVTATISLGTPGTLTLPAGDAVRDTTSVSVSSDTATTVDVAVWNSDQSAEVKAIDLVTLTDEALSTSVTVPVTDLAAGSYVLVATPSVGTAVTAPLTVGSGTPVDVSLALAKSTLFTYAYSSATPRSTTATVTATDETGLGVAFTGKVTAVVGGKSKVVAVNSSTGNPANVALSSTGLGYGTGTATATVTGNEGTTNASDAVPLSVRQLAFSSVSIATSSASVYPYKDYYYDSVKITVTPKSSAGVTFGATGSVKITRNGKTVKTWTLTSSSAKALTWDGRVGGKIVPGTYKITASIKGKEGSTKTYAKNVVVKSNKLVTKTKTVTYSGAKAFARYLGFDAYAENACYSNYPRAGYVFCDADAAAADPDDYAVMSFAQFTIPTEVQSAQKYGGTKASATLYNVKRYYGGGDVYLETDKGTWRAATLASGTKAVGSIAFESGAKKVYLTMGLFDYSQISVGSVKVTYTYKVLTS